MNREALENRIKHYFTQEGAEADLSSRQWLEVLSHVRKQKQRRWPWGAVIPSTPRPLTAMAASLLLVVVVGGVSLWVTAPWQATSPGQPSPVDGLRGPPGRPAPRFFEATWTADRSVISPGEALTITGTLKNVWDQRIDVPAFPETVTLDLVDTRDAVAVPLTFALGIPNSIEPGLEVSFVAHVPPDVSARLQPGRYRVVIEIAFAHTPDEPQQRITMVGFNSGSGVLFVVVPPQGALNKTVQVGEVREVKGATVTLEAIYFTPEKTTIVALAVLTAPRLPTPTSPPPPSPGATATPFPTVAPTAPPGREYSANPWHRIDGGEWRELWGGGLSYRETPEGIHLEWTLGPVPADAKTFDFSIGRLGHFVSSPGQQVIGPWEWTVQLQEAGR